MNTCVCTCMNICILAVWVAFPIEFYCNMEYILSGFQRNNTELSCVVIFTNLLDACVLLPTKTQLLMGSMCGTTSWSKKAN